MTSEEVQRSDWHIPEVPLHSREDQPAGPAVRQPCHTPHHYPCHVLPCSGTVQLLKLYKGVCAAVYILRFSLVFSSQVCSPGLLTWVHDKANLPGQQPKRLENSQAKAAAILANYLTRGGSQPAAVRDLGSPLPGLGAPLWYCRGRPANQAHAAIAATTT